MVKTDEMLDDVRDRFIADGGCPCCFIASNGGYGGWYWKLCDKQDRRRDRLQQLRERVK